MVLSDQIGVAPSHAFVILNVAAIGITNATWRNSPLEGWHAEGRIHDGGMLRTNVATTKLVREVLSDHLGEIIGDEGVPLIATEDLVDLEADFTDELFVAILNGSLTPSESCLMDAPCASSLARISMNWSTKWTGRSAGSPPAPSDMALLSAG